MAGKRLVLVVMMLMMVVVVVFTRVHLLLVHHNHYLTRRINVQSGCLCQTMRNNSLWAGGGVSNVEVK